MFVVSVCISDVCVPGLCMCLGRLYICVNLSEAVYQFVVVASVCYNCIPGLAVCLRVAYL